MLQHGNFSQREWDLAPTYVGPGHSSKVIALDFPVLEAIAQGEESKGAFRPNGDDVLSMAPLRLEHLPAALYRVQTARPEVMGEYTTTGDETLVVVNGVLKLVQEEAYKNGATGSMRHMIYPGQTANLSDQRVNVEAVGVFNPANCLALAIYGDGIVNIAGRDVPILGQS